MALSEAQSSMSAFPHAAQVFDLHAMGLIHFKAASLAQLSELLAATDRLPYYLFNFFNLLL